jgi:WD40 repeat protein
VYSVSGDQVKENGEWSGKHRGVVTSLDFSADGKFLTSADANRDIFVWDLATKQYEWIR